MSAPAPFDPLSVQFGLGVIAGPDGVTPMVQVMVTAGLMSTAFVLSAEAARLLADGLPGGLRSAADACSTNTAPKLIVPTANDTMHVTRKK